MLSITPLRSTIEADIAFLRDFARMGDTCESMNITLAPRFCTASERSDTCPGPRSAAYDALVGLAADPTTFQSKA